MNEFERRYRREPRAFRLRGHRAVVLGAGAMGSFIDAFMAHSGLDVLAVDNDRLEPANRFRHYLRNAALDGQYKATALAKQLQGEASEFQRIRSLVADLRPFTADEFRALLRGASLAIGCTGIDEIDRVADTAAFELGIPYLVPSLWAGEHPILGDLLINAWNLRDRPGACFSCLRPPRTTAGGAAEAQPGFEAEVYRVASLTAEIAIALLLPDSPQHEPLTQQLRRGANYVLVPRWPPSPRMVVTRPRRDCRICSTSRATTSATHWDIDTASVRDWCIGLILASAVFWHQLVPGLDASAATALIAAGGLWWRGRLPSYASVTERLRRWWTGR